MIIVPGLLCMLNAAVAMIVKAIPDSVVWSGDGILELAIGTIMLHMSPALG